MPVNATPIVPQTQPASDSEHEWSCAQARSASSTRDEYARAWYRKLIFLHFSLILEVIAFVAYVAAMPTRYQWGISAFLGMLETSFIGMFVIPALVFLYIFICLQLEDFFLLKHQSVAFAWIT
jgi:F0F1-type ATP synthase assembly protein I